jgi:hypothetical protein
MHFTWHGLRLSCDSVPSRPVPSRLRNCQGNLRDATSGSRSVFPPLSPSSIYILTPQIRLRLACDWINTHCLTSSTGLHSKTVDRVNILQAADSSQQRTTCSQSDTLGIIQAEQYHGSWGANGYRNQSIIPHAMPAWANTLPLLPAFERLSRPNTIGVHSLQAVPRLPAHS